jgi:hypothetical protein
MRRSWRSRLLAAIYSLWLFVVLGEPPMVHTCPVHSLGHAGHAMAMGGMAMGDMPMDGMASHHHGATQSPSAPSDHSSKTCTCLGDCCSVVPAALPAPRIVATVVETVRIPTPGRPQHEYVAAWVDFVLPFSTAPPATV